MRPGAARILAAFLLAFAVHIDWHLARPGHHSELSGQLAQHWLFAVPVFALLALYLSRQPVAVRWRESARVILVGLFLGQVVEPLSELLTDDAPWSWAFGGVRWTAFGEFVGAGLVTYLIIMAVREARSGAPGYPGGD